MGVNDDILNSLFDDEEKKKQGTNAALLDELFPEERQPQKLPTPGEQALINAKAGLRNAAQGLTFGAADEMEAYIADLFGGDYDQYRKEIEDERATYVEDYPKSAFVGGVSGGLLNPINKFGAGSGVLANAGIDTALGAATGALSAREGESRGEEALYGAGEGLIGGQLMRGLVGGAKGLFGTGRNVELDTPEGFTPYHMAGDDTDPGFLRWVYQQMVGPGSGGGKLRQQQRDVVGTAEDTYQELKKQAKLEIKSNKKQIRREAGDLINQDKRALTESVGNAQAGYRNQIAQQSLPDALPPEQMQEISSSMQTDPQRAIGMLQDLWARNGFQNIKQLEFNLEPDALIREAVKDIPSHMDESIPIIRKIMTSELGRGVDLDVPIPTGRAGGAPTYAGAKDIGKISGTDLIQTRNELRFLVNAMGDDGREALTKAGLARAADKIDDQIRKQLPDNMRGQYDDELKRWGVFLTARDAAGKAGVDRQGLFDATDILRAEKSNLGARFAGGKSALRKSAQSLQRQEKSAQEGLEQTIAARKIGREDALDIASDTPEALEDLIDTSKQRFEDLQRRSGMEPRSFWQTNLANLALTSPIHAVTALMTSGASLFATPLAAYPMAKALGSALSSPKTQRYFAGNTQWQKFLKKGIDKMPKEQRQKVFQSTVGALRTWMQQNYEDLE